MNVPHEGFRSAVSLMLKDLYQKLGVVDNTEMEQLKIELFWRRIEKAFLKRFFPRLVLHLSKLMSLRILQDAQSSLKNLI